MSNKVKCPKCGKTLTLQPCPGKPGRMVAFCECNPRGPVLETDALPETNKKREVKDNGSTKHD